MKAWEPSGYPTVLIAELEEPVFAALARSFRGSGYNVLEARDWNDAHKFIRTHSRPIHVLLTNPNLPVADLDETAEQYRHGLRILFVSQNPGGGSSNVLAPEAVLRAATDILEPLMQRYKESERLDGRVQAKPPARPWVQQGVSAAKQIA